MLTDKTGRNLHVGQLVDVSMVGMFSGMVVEVSDSVLQLPGGRKQPKMIMVQIGIPIFADERGVCHNSYIIGSVGKEKMKEMGMLGDDKPAGDVITQ